MRSKITNNRQITGFTLVEIAVVLVIIALLSVFATGLTTQALNKQRRDTTIARLALIDSALALFVAQNQFLPCPALGTLNGAAAVPDVRLGKEQVNALRAGCNLTNQQHGILPWVTLGIASADVQDGWGNMFTYRVEESLVRTGSMNFTMCSPAGTNAVAVGTAPNLTCAVCTTATFPAACNAPAVVTAGRGLRVKSVANTIIADPLLTPSTGAAYVIISHGENQSGAYQFDGLLVAGSVASGTQELVNYANSAYTPLATAYLVDDVTNYATTAAHFDDFVLRTSIMSLAARAQLGPRAY